MIEKIEHKGKLLAIIIPSSHETQGIEFYTPNDFSQQLACMSRPKNHRIDAHYHNRVERNVSLTQECLVIRKGKIRVDLYDQDQLFVCERTLVAGDVILLASGGHGFTMLEETDMVEVKQGPYSGDQDKTRFQGKYDNNES